MSQYTYFPPSKSLQSSSSPTQKQFPDSFSSTRPSKSPEPDLKNVYTFSKEDTSQFRNHFEHPKKSPPFVLDSDLDSLKYHIYPEETLPLRDSLTDFSVVNPPHDSDQRHFRSPRLDLETVPEQTESEMTLKTNKTSLMDTNKNSFKFESEELFQRSELKASGIKLIEGFNTARSQIEDKIKVIENLKGDQSLTREEVQTRLNALLLELEGLKLEISKMKNERLRMMEENEKIRESMIHLEDELYYRRQEVKKAADEIRVLRVEKEGLVQKWQTAESEKEDLERLNSELAWKNKEAEKEFQLHLEEVSLMNEKKLEQKINELMMDKQHQFHTKERKIRENSDKLKVENQTLRIENEALIKRVRDQEFEILSNRKAEKVNYSLNSPLNMKKMMDELLSELDIKASSLEELHQEIAQFKNYYKQVNKFTDLVLDMTTNCHPPDYFPNNKPTLKQAWKWLKNVLEKYMQLKKSTLRNEEGLKNAMIVEEFNELVNILIENLHINKKSEIIGKLYQVVNENNVFNRMLPNVKKWLKMDKKASLKEVERRLEEIG